MNDYKIKQGLDALIKRALNMQTCSIKNMGLGNMSGVMEDLNRLIIAHGAACTLEEFEWVDYSSTFEYTVEYTVVPFTSTFDKLPLKTISVCCITNDSDEYKISQMKQRFEQKGKSLYIN